MINYIIKHKKVIVVFLIASILSAILAFVIYAIQPDTISMLLFFSLGPITAIAITDPDADRFTVVRHIVITTIITVAMLLVTLANARIGALMLAFTFGIVGHMAGMLFDGQRNI